MDDQTGRPAKGLVRSALELLGLTQSSGTTKRERRANIAYLVGMVVVTFATRELSLGRRALAIALGSLGVYLVVSTVCRFLPEPRRRSDIPPRSH